MRAVDAIAAISISVMAGCGRPAAEPPRFADARAAVVGEGSVATKLTPPRGACLEQARRHVPDGADLPTALDAETHERTLAVLHSLHPVAKRVLLRTHGVWVADDIPDAAAIFLPCDVDEESATGGFVLIDKSQFPFERERGPHDVDVPALYWRSLAVDHADADLPHRGSSRKRSPSPSQHPMRYLLLHELGHAFSLLAGEFGVDERGRMLVTGTHGFVGLSWRMMTTERKYLPSSGTGPLVQAVVPRRHLDTFEWGSVLAALDADPALLAPGFRMLAPRSAVTRAHDVCSVVHQLPMAGFVTPTAARYPTEDFAEMFAHAVLAAEGKIKPGDWMPIDLPGCSVRNIPSPYFSRWLAPKRRYVETALGLRAP